MTIGCNAIVACILKNCANLVPGIKDKIYFINYDCVDKALSTFDPDNSLLLTQLVLNTVSPACYAYCVEGYNFSNEHTIEMVKTKYQKNWEHGVIFRIFDNTPEDKLWIENAKDSRFLVIIENNYNKDLTAIDPAEVAGRTVFEVLGWDFGLELNAVERNVNDEEMLGGYVLTAGCSDTMKESLLPRTLFVGGTLALTRTALADLLAPCCP
jgi:hypothetical protein